MNKVYGGKMKLSDQLKKYRVLNKFTQEDLAQHIHITRQAISRWENDLSEPDLTTLKKMADLYNIQLEELVNGNIYDYETKHNQLKFYYYLSILSFIIPLGFIISLYILISIRKKQIEYKILKGVCISRILLTVLLIVFILLNFM